MEKFSGSLGSCKVADEVGGLLSDFPFFVSEEVGGYLEDVVVDHLVHYFLLEG